MDAGGPVDEIGLIDIDNEGDSLLQMEVCRPDQTLRHAFCLADIASTNHDFPLKENALSGDNNLRKSKCLAVNGDGKENLSGVMDDSIEASLVSEDPQQATKRKKAKGFNLRKSLAWHKAFFTEEGVLDPSELCTFNCSFNQTTKSKLFAVNEVEDTSLSSYILESTNLQAVEETASIKSHKKKPLMQDEKLSVSSSIKPVSLTMKNASCSPALSKVNATRKVGQFGVCSRPPASNSQGSQILGKAVYSTSSTQKLKSAKAHLSMSFKNPALDKKKLQSTDKNTGRKHSSTKGATDTNIHVAPGLSTTYQGKNSTKAFSVKTKVLKEKSKKPITKPHQGLELCEVLSSVNNLHNQIGESSAHLSSARSPCSSVDTSVGNNLHNRQAGNPLDLHLPGGLHSAGMRRDTLDKKDSMPNPDLPNGERELNSVSSHSHVQLPVYQGTNSTLRSLLPEQHHQKPSALRMPSPTLGFFGQAKAFGAHIQTCKNALEAGCRTHVSTSGKAIGFPQVGNLNNECLPSFGKVPKPRSAVVGTATSQIRLSSTCEHSTEVDSPPAFFPKLEPNLEAKMPGMLKLEAPSDPQNDVQLFMKSNPEASNGVIERKQGHNNVHEIMSSEKCQQGCGSQEAVVIGQCVDSAGHQSPNEEKQHNDENKVDVLNGDISKGVQNDKPPDCLNTDEGIHDDKFDTRHMAFPCSRLIEMPSVDDQVLSESMPIERFMAHFRDKEDSQYDCESATDKPLSSSKSIALGLSVPDVVAQLESSEKPIEMGNHVIDKKRLDVEGTLFSGSIVVDSWHPSERKKICRTSGSISDVYLEETGSQVVAMVTHPSNFQEHDRSLCTTTKCECTMKMNQEQLSRPISLQDKFSLQEIDVHMIQENGSLSCRESAEVLLVTSLFELPISKEQTEPGNEDLDNVMTDKVVQSVDHGSDSSMDKNNDIHCKGKINNQDICLLVDSSLGLAEELEASAAVSLMVHDADENLINVDSLNKMNEWSNPDKGIHYEQDIISDSRLAPLMVDPASGMTEEVALGVKMTQIVAGENCESDYGVNNTSGKVQEFPTFTSKGDYKAVGEEAQCDVKNHTCTAQNKGAVVSNNELPSDCSKQEPVSRNYPIDVAPFSDEWISAMEASGEDVFKKKTGAVQNSPPDKVLPEPGPWSPVKRKSQDVGPFDCTKYTAPVSNST